MLSLWLDAVWMRLKSTTPGGATGPHGQACPEDHCLMALGEPKMDRRAKLREATRREILDAAWQVAREHGLGAVTLREIAVRVGMGPPSLYSHFPSKMAIYDAMYQQGWEDYRAVATRMERGLPEAPRPALRAVAATFFDFALAEPARAQLMNQRLIPGFEPTPAA